MRKPPALIIDQICHDFVAMHRNAKIAIMLAADIIALPVCLFIALVLRLGDAGLAATYGPGAFAVAALVTIAALSMSELYRAVIRFIDQRMLAVTGLALGVAVLSLYCLLWALGEPQFPRSALAIYWFIAFSYIVASRTAVRNFLRRRMAAQPRSDHTVAIYGAGEPGAQLALTMRTSNEYRPVCFFDEKQAMHERTIAGLRVFDPGRLAEMADALSIRSVIIALPRVSPERLRAITQRVAQSGVAPKILSRLLALSDEKAPSGAATGPAIRELKVEDLLGRAPVPPRHDLFGRCVTGKTVLVSGAGGSIGSELCRQIVTLQPAQLHLLDHSEFALYTIKQELAVRFPDLSIVAHLGSVCSAPLLERILREDRIDTIYHAAAYKHVPLVEANIVEGLRNNVLGAQVVASAAARAGVETCVLISSDKAVRPTNIMGASKRIAELIFQAAAAEAAGTTFCMVRFGNVLGSSGSVIPLFQRQIAHGGPLTITHPEVSRYFMLIPEAAQLVIQAGAMAKGGDVFVLDMGEPIRIVDLARTMIVMSGLTEKTPLQPDGDIEIKFVGLFPGEKLNEELLTDGKVFPSEHPRIMRMKENALHPGILNTYITFLMTACDTYDRAMIESMVKAIVTEYTPQYRPAAVNTPANSPVNTPAKKPQVAPVKTTVPYRI
jgi:FlaA1/EpsC-like NDP-sugar epimerase